jgi:hypothetical protein
MSPEKQLITASSVFKLGKLNISLGRLPVSWLLFNKIVDKLSWFIGSNIFANDPSNLLEFRNKPINDFRFLNDGGIVPLKVLELSSRNLN